MPRSWSAAVCAAVMSARLCAGPVEFGLLELQKAVDAGKVPAIRARIAAEVWPGTKADAFEIVPYRVSGGDLRGLMYGLLEASEQIQRSGKLTAMKAEPAVGVRGVRIILRNADWEKTSFYDRAFWSAYFARLARARFNRFQLVLGEEAWHPPQLPYLFSLPFFERVEVEGLTPFERGRNLDALKMITQTAADYAIDVTLGMSFGNTGSRVQNLTDEFRAPYLRAALPHLLEEVPWIRAVAVHQCPEEILREAVIPALQGAGRLVTLEVPDQPSMLAREMGASVRILSPLASGEAFPDLSTLRPRELPVIRVVTGSRWTDPRYVRRVAAGVALGSALGFEVEGSMDLSSPEAELLYAAWGRLGYQPKGTLAQEGEPVMEAIACAQRVENPALTISQLEECAVRLERSENKDMQPLAQRAALRVRLMWAKTMEDYYGSTRHESALRAAFHSYRAAARVSPEYKADVDRLAKLIEQLDPDQPFTPMPWTVLHRVPALLHVPLPVAFTGTPLQIALSIPPTAAITSVRLHYRHLSGSGGFQTLESTAKQPRLTIPASQLEAPGQLIYYIEFVHATGVWRLPDENADSPVFLTLLKTPVVEEADPPLPVKEVMPKKQK